LIGGRGHRTASRRRRGRRGILSGRRRSHWRRWCRGRHRLARGRGGGRLTLIAAILSRVLAIILPILPAVLTRILPLLRGLGGRRRLRGWACAPGGRRRCLRRRCCWACCWRGWSGSGSRRRRRSGPCCGRRRRGNRSCRGGRRRCRAGRCWRRRCGSRSRRCGRRGLRRRLCGGLLRISRGWRLCELQEASRLGRHCRLNQGQHGHGRTGQKYGFQSHS